ncbi:hypothetical protein MLD38_026962 [Melastoma candidum]|uniref:Uncharacterized protein n=1 Tax=Melastoma candidum TaxID=119954 RepID=A0ACB9P0Q6_9MYRT|nr:hypothetical protein MLD38_026962 [Melastoma candidum]
MSCGNGVADYKPVGSLRYGNSPSANCDSSSRIHPPLVPSQQLSLTRRWVSRPQKRECGGQSLPFPGTEGSVCC